jgi:hypothetical protein
MTRISFLLAAVIGLSGAAMADVEQATVDALAGTYVFGASEMPGEGCRVTLKREPVLRKAQHVLRPALFNSACAKTFSSLHGVTHWAATGGASIALFGGDPLTETADFSPVQDATGVYLRGGFEGDSKIYELRPLP